MIACLTLGITFFKPCCWYELNCNKTHSSNLDLYRNFKATIIPWSSGCITLVQLGGGNIGSNLTSEFAKVDRCLQINYRNLTCLQVLITLSLQLGFGQNYHQKKWNFKSFPIKCRSKQLDTYWVQMLENISCTLVSGLGEKLMQKRHKLMSILIRFRDGEPTSLSSHVLTSFFTLSFFCPRFICESYIY